LRVPPGSRDGGRAHRLILQLPVFAETHFVGSIFLSPGYKYLGKETGHVNILAWFIIGLIAGAIARLLVPGRDRLGFVGTIALGLSGSLIGGAVGYLLESGHRRFSPAGLFGSIIGAMIALLIYRATIGRRRGILGFRRRSRL
jgi:uncharacterized membrane protein YeaQ/YmgE (transglycosylase-associated protein family)